MRLQAPSREHWLRERIIQRLIRLRLDAVPDVVLACQHRDEFFGTPFLAWVQASVRGSSQWTQGERELMAALVSDRNRCAFCIGAHSATAAPVVGDEAVCARCCEPIVINRVADALASGPQDKTSLALSTRRVTTRGYGV